MAMVNLVGGLKETDALRQGCRAGNPCANTPRNARLQPFCAFCPTGRSGASSTTRKTTEKANTAVNAHKRCRAGP
jgi:hypothetical protein